MNGFSSMSRQAMNRSPAPARAARRRFAKARTESSKNITPKRETTASKAPASKAWSCASARTNETGTSSRSARAPAASSIGPEMSTPTHVPAGPSRRARATVVPPVPQPTSSTLPPRPSGTASTSRSCSGRYNASTTSWASTQALPDGPFQRAACSSSGLSLASMTASCGCPHGREMTPSYFKST